MTLGGDEAPKRNEKTTAFLRKGRSFFCYLGRRDNAKVLKTLIVQL